MAQMLECKASIPASSHLPPPPEPLLSCSLAASSTLLRAWRVPLHPGLQLFHPLPLWHLLPLLLHGLQGWGQEASCMEEEGEQAEAHCPQGEGEQQPRWGPAAAPATFNSSSWSAYELCRANMLLCLLKNLLRIGLCLQSQQLLWLQAVVLTSQGQ